MSKRWTQDMVARASLRSAVLTATLLGACTEPTPSIDGGMDARLASDVGIDAPLDCNYGFVDVPSGSLRCGNASCGHDEACCEHGYVDGCWSAECLSRESDYPDGCVYLRECDGTDAAQCDAGEGCCLMDGEPSERGLRCTPFALGCARVWACQTGVTPSGCPPAMHCDAIDLEGGTGCVADEDAGTDAR